jgi:hypothetical protein
MKNFCSIIFKKFKKRKMLTLLAVVSMASRKNLVQTACLEIQTKLSNARDGDYAKCLSLEIFLFF